MTIRETNRAGLWGRTGRGVLLVALGAALGAALTGALKDPAPLFPATLFAQDGGDQIDGNLDGDYAFFTFRRNLWAVHLPTGRVQFFLFPDGKEQQITRSRVHQIDLDAFPIDQVRYQLSERNLTNFLWLLNPITGKAQYIRAGRDGIFEFSDIESVARRE
jgi:hypothetical protein